MKRVERNKEEGVIKLTALTSPKFPAVAKCALKLAFELPAQTPHSDLRQLAKLKTATRSGLGNPGLKQSRIMPESFKISAVRRYILHSGSSAVPKRSAKAIVAMRPTDSWRTERSSAAVGVAFESPTPTPLGESEKGGRELRGMGKIEQVENETNNLPCNTALEANIPAIDDEKA